MTTAQRKTMLRRKWQRKEHQRRVALANRVTRRMNAPRYIGFDVVSGSEKVSIITQ